VNKNNHFKVDSSLKMNQIINKLSVKIINSFEETALSDDQIQQNKPIVKNEKIYETELLLSLSKHIDVSNNSYFKKIVSPSGKVNSDNYYSNSSTIKNIINKVSNVKNEIKELNIKNTTRPIEEIDMPIYVRQLINDKNPILKNSDNYKNSIKTNSKFQFLFNTIHMIEILEYNNKTKEENWSLLTKTKIESLPNKQLNLCRLTNYKNTQLGIDGIDQIKLPIYNQYFLFMNDGFPRNNSLTTATNNQQKSTKNLKDLLTTTIDAKVLTSIGISKVLNEQIKIEKELLSISSTSVKQMTNNRNPFSKSKTNNKKKV
jgi:hypothetical protein